MTLSNLFELPHSVSNQFSKLSLTFKIGMNVFTFTFRLSYNPIGDEGIGNLATALESNTTVTVLQ